MSKGRIASRLKAIVILYFTLSPKKELKKVIVKAGGHHKQ